jgi:hypothetical protein
MRRAPIFVAIAFLAGFGIGYFVRGATTVQQKNAHAPDLAGIEKLHHEDIEVTLSQDPKGLMDIWTEDAVRYVVGRQAIGDDNAKGLAPYRLQGVERRSQIQKHSSSGRFGNRVVRSPSHVQIIPRRPAEHPECQRTPCDEAAGRRLVEVRGTHSGSITKTTLSFIMHRVRSEVSGTASIQTL